LAELPQHADIYIIAVKDSALQEVIEHLCSRLQTSAPPFWEGMGVGSESLRNASHKSHITTAKHDGMAVFCAPASKFFCAVEVLSFYVVVSRTKYSNVHDYKCFLNLCAKLR
jgi:hypothetical protein